MTTPLRVLMIGFGRVGRKMARLLSLERGLHDGLEALSLSVVGIVTRGRGSLVNPGGIDLARAVGEVEGEGRFGPHNPHIARIDGFTAARTLSYDVLVELSTLDIEHGGEPALSHLRAALEKGRHAVTANKGPIAFAYEDLAFLSRQRGARLLFESTVMDGAPVFNMAREGLEGCRVLAVEGVLNSTTNFVLSGLERGGSMDEAIRRAREEGFAEADPSQDLEGWDSAAKIAALANVLMQAGITPFDVARESASNVRPQQVQDALARGARLKQVCRALREGVLVRAGVSLEEVPLEDSLARVEGSGSALRIRTDLMGPILLAQEAPTLSDTAYGVLNDLLSLRST